MQTIFGKFIKESPPLRSEVYELKICKTGSLPFDVVKEHQINALIEAKGGFYHKLTDPPIFYGNQTRFNVKRPFDCFYVLGVEAYVVVWYYVPRAKKRFIKIPIRSFIQEKEESSRKSLTEKRALEIGEVLYVT